MPLELVFVVVLSVPFYVAIANLLGERFDGAVDEKNPGALALQLRPYSASTLDRLKKLEDRSLAGIEPLRAIAQNPRAFFSDDGGVTETAPVPAKSDAASAHAPLLLLERLAEPLTAPKAQPSPEPRVARGIDQILPAGPARLNKFDPETDALVVMYSGMFAPRPCQQVLDETGLTISFSDGATVFLPEVTRELAAGDFAYQSSLSIQQKAIKPSA